MEIRETKRGDVKALGVSASEYVATVNESSQCSHVDDRSWRSGNSTSAAFSLSTTFNTASLEDPVCASLWLYR